MEIITAQTDMVGKISRPERINYMFCGFKIMQMWGESVGVKVKRLFVIEPQQNKRRLLLTNW